MFNTQLKQNQKVNEIGYQLMPLVTISQDLRIKEAAGCSTPAKLELGMELPKDEL
jgi:hypothetical protein